MPGGPELQLLDSKRETRRRMIASSSSGVHVRVDNFNANPSVQQTAGVRPKMRLRRRQTWSCA
eukprot:14428701-Alexandrium_andersonii.AAC.1